VSRRPVEHPFPGSGRLASAADARDLGLDRTEQGFVNVESCMPQNQYCRTHQAVRNRNHRIAARRGNKLGLEAPWSTSTGRPVPCA
jgi:hypothetical protein